MFKKVIVASILIFFVLPNREIFNSFDIAIKTIKNIEIVLSILLLIQGIRKYTYWKKRYNSLQNMKLNSRKRY